MRSTNERRISAAYLSKVCHLLAVFRSHIRMKQDRLFLGPGEQRFQLFAPQNDAREIVFASDGGHPVLDRLDDVRSLLAEPRQNVSTSPRCAQPRPT
jgi:hypothetical protein